MTPLSRLVRTDGWPRARNIPSELQRDLRRGLLPLCCNCGQIDEEPYHDAEICNRTRSEIAEAVRVSRMSSNAQAFLAANRRSPVISGSAIGNGGEGGHYTLRSGRSFTLTREECEQVGMPRWLGAE